jgi:hypothetical protein
MVSLEREFFLIVMSDIYDKTVAQFRLFITRLNIVRLTRVIETHLKTNPSFEWHVTQP